MNYNFAGQCNHALGQFEEALAHYNIAYKHASQIKAANQLEEALKADILFNRG